MVFLFRPPYRGEVKGGEYDGNDPNIYPPLRGGRGVIFLNSFLIVPPLRGVRGVIKMVTIRTDSHLEGG